MPHLEEDDISPATGIPRKTVKWFSFLPAPIRHIIQPTPVLEQEGR